MQTALLPLCVDYSRPVVGKTKSEMDDSFSTLRISPLELSELMPVLRKYIRPTSKLLTLGFEKKFNSAIRAEGFQVSELNASTFDGLIGKSSQHGGPIEGHEFVLPFRQYNVILDQRLDIKLDKVLSLVMLIYESLDVFGRYIGVFPFERSKQIVEFLSHKSLSFILQLQPILLAKPEVSLIILTKLRTGDGSKQIFELVHGDKKRRIEPSSLSSDLKLLEDYVYQIRDLQADQFLAPELEIGLYQDHGVLRYRLFVCHPRNPKPKIRISQYCYAAFIVPETRAKEWLFSTVEGRKSLLSMTRAHRLVIVHVCQDLPNSEVQDELKERLKEMAPQGFTDFTKVQFLTIGDDEDNPSNIIYEANSEFSGGYWIKDVRITHEEAGSKKYVVYRRLIFASCRNQTQSEARLMGDGKSIDHSYLASEYHSHMILSLCFYQKLCALLKASNEEACLHKFCLIGLGGGCLASFAQNNLNIGRVQFDTVEIDPEMANVATKYFGLNLSQGDNQVICNILVEDGVKFVNRKAETNETYDVIMFDINCSEPGSALSCPPPEFVEEDILLKVLRMMPASRGLFLLNLVTRSVHAKQDIENLLCKIFTGVAFVTMTGTYLNVLYICSNAKLAFQSKGELSKFAKRMVRNFDSLQKTLQIDEFWSNLKTIK